MRHVVTVGGVVLGLLMAAGAEAQTTFERGWIDVNVAVAMAAEDAFSMRATTEMFDEPADFGTGYALPRGAAFDVGGGLMITPIVGVGVSFSGTAHSDAASLSARIPHPRIYDTYATDEVSTDETLERIEGAVNIQAMIVAVRTARFRLRVFGGPTYFRVQQDAVTDIRYAQDYLPFFPINEIEITEFDSARIEGHGWGFHAGADASVFFNRLIGVGGFAKVSRGSIDLENTLATAVGQSAVVGVKTGGFQVGGGLRLKF